MQENDEVARYLCKCGHHIILKLHYDPARHIWKFAIYHRWELIGVLGMVNKPRMAAELILEYLDRSFGYGSYEKCELKYEMTWR